MVHPKVVPHLVCDHKHRLKVVPLIDCARVVRVTHARDPGKPDHTGNIRDIRHHEVITTAQAKNLWSSLRHPDNDTVVRG